MLVVSSSTSTKVLFVKTIGDGVVVFVCFFISLLREFAGKCSSIYYITILFHVAFEVACSSLLKENPYFKSICSMLQCSFE